MAIRLTEQADGVVLGVKVVPGASRDRIAGEYDGLLKITVAKAPQHGAANAAVVELLAKQLAIPRQQIVVVQGHTNPRKTLKIQGVTADALRQAIEQCLR